MFDLRAAPDVAIAHPDPSRRPGASSRRGFLLAAAGLMAAGASGTAFGRAMVFSTAEEAEADAARRAAEGRAQLIVNGRKPKPTTAPARQAAEQAPAPARAAPSADAGPQLVINGAEQKGQEALHELALGEIPRDFWQRPRELHLQRQGTNELLRVVYWKDGKLLPEGYWAACNLLRDVRANMMTYMDPAILDILRGIVGYYEAWNWKYPIIITSGYRTPQTNDRLGEGAAKNSMHLYGRATDLYMQRIPVAHLAQLGMHFQRGGVGFYPQRGFVHLDTGRIRSWRG